jgi:threonine dehydrogenase-like Zn-dependent dehydrogenase
MLGVVPVGNKKVELRTFSTPEVGPGEVLVEVKLAGICGSDLHAFNMTWEQIGERQGLIVGHEAGGVVKDVGPGVRNVKVGQRVSVYHYRGCCSCQHCVSGQIMWCEEKKAFGWHMHGSDAEYVIVDEMNCCPLPEELSFDDAAFLGCAAGTGYSALRKLEDVQAEDTFVVLGLGPVGLTSAMFALAKGWQVLGVDMSKERTEFAAKQGVPSLQTNPGDDLVEILKGMYGGKLPKRVFDSTGSEFGLATGIHITGQGGKIVTVGKGMWPMKFNESINVAEVIRKQMSIMGSWVSPLPYYWDMTNLMIRHGMSFSKLVTKRYPLAEAQAAFELANDKSTVGKIVFEM